MALRREGKVAFISGVARGQGADTQFASHMRAQTLFRLICANKLLLCPCRGACKRISLRHRSRLKPLITEYSPWKRMFVTELDLKKLSMPVSRTRSRLTGPEPVTARPGFAQRRSPGRPITRSER